MALIPFGALESLIALNNTSFTRKKNYKGGQPPSAQGLTKVTRIFKNAYLYLFTFLPLEEKIILWNYQLLK
jgi:hypothetical protein